MVIWCGAAAPAQSSDNQPSPDAEGGAARYVVELADVRDGGAVFCRKSAQRVARTYGVRHSLRCGNRLLFGLSVVRIDAEIVLLDREDGVAQSAVLEVDDALRVERLAHVSGLEVQMRPGAASGVAAVADYLASLDHLVGVDVVLGQMPVVGLEAVGVSQDNQIAVAARPSRKLGYAHLAVEGGPHRRPDGQRNVGASVGPCAPEGVARPHLADNGWHKRVQRVDQKNVDLVGYFAERQFLVCVNLFGVPMVVEVDAVEDRPPQAVIFPTEIVVKHYFGEFVASVDGVDRLADAVGNFFFGCFFGFVLCERDARQAQAKHQCG